MTIKAAPGLILALAVAAALAEGRNYRSLGRVTRGANSFRCPSEGFHPDPTDCRTFYRCVDWNSNAFFRDFTEPVLAAFQFTCSEGTVFDPDFNICNHPRDTSRSECGGRAGGDSNNQYPFTYPPLAASENGYPNGAHHESGYPGYQPPNEFATRYPDSSGSYPNEYENQVSPDVGRPESSADCMSEGFFPVPGDCKRFIRCTDDGMGGYRKFVFRCGEGTVWDQQNLVCNYPSAVPGCTGSGSGSGHENPTTDGYNENENGQGMYPTNESQGGQGPEQGNRPGQSEEGGRPPTTSYPQEGNQGGYPGQQPGQGNRPVQTGYPQQGNRPDQSGYPQQGNRPDQTGYPQQGSRPDQTGYPQQGNRPDQSGYPQQGNRPDPSGYPQQGNRPDQTGYPQQGNRPDQSGYPQQGNRPDQTGYPQQGNRPDQTGYPQQGNRPDQSGYPQQGNRPDQTGYPQQGNRPDQSGYPQQGSQGGIPEQRPQRPTQGSRPPPSTPQNQGNYPPAQQPGPQRPEQSGYPQGGYPGQNRPTGYPQQEGYPGNRPPPPQENRPDQSGYPQQGGYPGSYPGQGNQNGYPGSYPEQGGYPDTQGNSPDEEYPDEENGNPPPNYTEGYGEGNEAASGSPNECQSDGFFSVPGDCMKFYRCVDNGKGGYFRYDFMCGPGTVWDQEITTCNHPWAVQRKDCSAGMTTEPSTDMTRSTPMQGTTSNQSPSQFSTQTTPSSSSQTQQPSSTTQKQMSSSSQQSQTPSKRPTGSQTPANGASGMQTGMTTPMRPGNRPTTMRPQPGTPETTPGGQTAPPGSSPCKPDANTPVKCEKAGFYPVPGNCRKFYRCVDWDGDKGERFSVYHFECGEGTIWDPALETCNHEESVYPPRDCSGGSGQDNATKPATTDESTDAADGSESTPSGQTDATTNGPDETSQTSPRPGTTSGESTASTPPPTDSGMPTTSPTDSDEGTTSVDSTPAESMTTASQTNRPTDPQSELTSPSENTTPMEPTTDGEMNPTSQRPDGSSGSPNQTDPNCPAVGEDQVAFVCPTGFRRHPKNCNLFYQCTISKEGDVNVMTLSCKNDSVYDERKIQCLPPDETDPCPSTSGRTRYYRRVEPEMTSVVPVVSSKSLCPGEGQFPYQGDCQRFFKCQKDRSGRMQGYLYQCPAKFSFSDASGRCERSSTLAKCSRSLQHLTPLNLKWMTSKVPIEYSFDAR